jgi:hypothetical protein
MAFGKYAGPHQKLDSSEVHVSKSVVTFQPFLFHWGNVLIGVAYYLDGCVENPGYLINTFVADRLRGCSKDRSAR